MLAVDVDAIEADSLPETKAAGSSTDKEWRSLEREHTVYSYLSRFLVSPMPRKNCIEKAVCASSTDRYPYEIIENTLVAGDTEDWMISYWSSKGEVDPQVPETLTYKLDSSLCVVDEIKINPFKAIFHDGAPIYSAKNVRFRMGYSSYTHEKDVTHHNDYVWLYVSPQYPMAQENILQSFKLPRPVICIGGIVQIELIGRVQKCEIDDLYYIGISYVQVAGLPLSRVFDVGILESSGNLILKYLAGARGHLEA